MTARPTATEFNFDSDEDFMAYIEDLRSRSEFTSDVEIQGSPPFKPWCRLFFMENEGEKRYNKHLEKRAAAVDRKAASAAEKGSRSGLRCESGRLGCA